MIHKHFWDGFDGNVKSKGGKFLTANDSFLKNKFQVLEAMHDLFAGPKAKEQQEQQSFDDQLQQPSDVWQQPSDNQ